MMGQVKRHSAVTKLECLSRDKLPSPPFPLVTYMKSFCKVKSEILGKLKLFSFDKLTNNLNLNKTLIF